LELVSPIRSKTGIAKRHNSMGSYVKTFIVTSGNRLGNRWFQYIVWKYQSL